MAKETDYIPRLVDDILDFKLKSKGAVWIRGAKWCGKSTTAKRKANTVVLMQDERTREANKFMARADPSSFLEGPTPFLIDEWQTIPFIWNQIRMEVDERNEFGQFILTGSMEPDMEGGDLHSGLGRVTDLLMRPMSLVESGDSSGAISLSALFNQEPIRAARCEKRLRDYAFYTARGGWPQAIGKEERVALQQAIDYYRGLIKFDLRVDGVNRDPTRMEAFIRSYSRNCSTLVANTTLRDDVAVNDSTSIDVNTITSYVKFLKEIYVLEEAKAWNPNTRSKTAIRTSNTRYFTDPSIACASLGLGPDALMRDPNTFGLLFENLCVRDLRVYADLLGGSVFHYRDKSDLEVDAVIVLPDGRWGAMEVKLGDPTLIEMGVQNLLKLKDNISGIGPEFLVILTTTPVAYQRDDGIWIVPLGCLGP